jgi:hypothetical protein
MKIEVTTGEVSIRSVVVRSHESGLYLPIMSIQIHTPAERSAGCNHSQIHVGGSPWVRYQVELYRVTRSLYDPTAVLLTAENERENDLLAGGLYDVDWRRWHTTLLAFPPTLFEDGDRVAVWEQFASSKVEYLQHL